MAGTCLIQGSGLRVLVSIVEKRRLSLSQPRLRLELTRFRGHPMVGAERSIHDAEEPWAVPTGVPATHRRAGSQRTDARGARTAVRAVGPVHPELGAPGRP